MSLLSEKRKARSYTRATPKCCFSCLYLEVANASGRLLCEKDGGAVRKFGWCKSFEPKGRRP